MVLISGLFIKIPIISGLVVKYLTFLNGFCCLTDMEPCWVKHIHCPLEVSHTNKHCQLKRKLKRSFNIQVLHSLSMHKKILLLLQPLTCNRWNVIHQILPCCNLLCSYKQTHYIQSRISKLWLKMSKAKSFRSIRSLEQTDSYIFYASRQ